ncbi:cell wall-binding repeat-containing protein [Herbiconiux sp. CPCC 205716]|uniref:Cell wall-binding repeat-containing protein n=1 Tax=Herbiconiux gentiana TaxID=2970912 RepID=A0ABT2GHU2_9MICO|nr:cell wall-binding repeat-containing protein [Herbiconiux gentiana]MCS5715798.1 cell wall-binding repeat-containing protein [Herbiconiux gentiana]
MLHHRRVAVLAAAALLTSVLLNGALTPASASAPAEVEAPPTDPGAAPSPTLIDPGSHLKTFDLPNPLGAPSDVVAGPDGSVWVAIFNDKQILRVSRNGVVLSTFQLTGGPTDLTTDADGGVWAAEFASNAIAHVDPTGAVSETKLPTANAFPSAVDASGPHVYFTESANHAFGRIARATGVVEEFPLAGSVAPTDIRVNVDSFVWVTDPDARTLWISGLKGQALMGFPLAGDSYGIAGTTGADQVRQVFNGTRVLSLTRLDPPDVLTSLDGAMNLVAVINVPPRGQMWFVDAGAGTIGWIRMSGSKSNPVAVDLPVGAPVGSAITDDRYIWTVSKDSGQLIRLDMSVSTVADRVGGADRFATAASVALAGHPKGAEAVFVASGESFPDALAAGPIAAQMSAPVLLTRKSELPESARTALQMLRPTRVVVIGGEAAVSEGVVRALQQMGLKVERVAGADRFAVSRALIASDLAPKEPNRVYVVTGRDFPDALAATPIAASEKAVSLLVDGRSTALSDLDKQVLQRIAARPNGEAVIVGGEAAVTGELESAIRGVIPTSRIAGPDRFAVAAALNRGLSGANASAFLASGESFADALTGGALAGELRKPLYLARRGCVPESIAAVMAVNVNRVTLLGGEAALSPAVASMTAC